MIVNSELTWRPLTLFERDVMKLLWKADLQNTSQFVSRLDELRAKSTGEVGCISLCFLDRISSDRQFGYTFPFVGEVDDKDGVLILIALFVEPNGEPLELEIARIDGGNTIAPIRIEDIKLVKSKGSAEM